MECSRDMGIVLRTQVSNDWRDVNIYMHIYICVCVCVKKSFRACVDREEENKHEGVEGVYRNSNGKKSHGPRAS